MSRGESIRPVDGRSRVTGSIQYSINVQLPGMLHARVLRSPYAHARIVSVDTTAAARAPGVKAVLSRNELIDSRYDIYFGQVIFDQTPVAVDKVRFVGDPVAAVAATDADAALNALSLIEVEYEELTPVFDPEIALAAGAPLIHEGPRKGMIGRPDVQARSLADTNIVHLFQQRKGDLELGFASADEVFENTFESPIVSHVALEPHNTVADVRDHGITIWASTQSPHQVQLEIARILRLPASNVRVVVSNLGGGFGGKMMSKIEPIATLLSATARRPVQLVMPRSEDFLISSQHGARVKLRTGVKRDGSLVAQHSICYYNAGPYADTTPNLITRGYAVTGPYRIPHIYTDSFGVYTNAIPAGAFRGYGITQVNWAHEAQMDILADALGLDPLEIRLRNVLRRGDHFTTGESMPELHYQELLTDAAQEIGWSNGPLRVTDGSKIRAKGIAAVIKGMASPTTATCSIKLNDDGSVNVLAGTVEMGQGSNTALAQIAADEMSVPVDVVRIIPPDTDATPFDTFTAASRSTYCMGVAISRAGDEVKRQLCELAADSFEVGVDDLILSEGRVAVRGVPSKSIAFSDLVRRSRQGKILGSGTHVAKDTLDGHEVRMDLETGQGYGSAEWHPAVIGCEVEIDTETGKIQVLQLHASLYAGRLINPRLCELQVEGSVVFGLGQALFEEVVFDTDGRVVNANLSDYMIPSFEDVPHRLSVHLLQPEDVTEVHGIGETALPPARAAIGNAISRAIGTHLLALPITPEVVLRALEAEKLAPSGTT